MLFNLTYGCYSLFIEIPRDADSCPNSEFERIPFPSLPFYTSTEGIWDLSENVLPQDAKQSITLSFDAMKDYTENTEINTETGKISITPKD